MIAMRRALSVLATSCALARICSLAGVLATAMNIHIQGHLRTTTARIFLDFSRQDDPVFSSAILLLRAVNAAPRGEPRSY